MWRERPTSFEDNQPQRTPGHRENDLVTSMVYFSPKTKTSQTQRVMGRSSNSPPPKSAHKQTTVFEKSWEWPECATWGSPGWNCRFARSAGLPMEDFWHLRGSVLHLV